MKGVDIPTVQGKKLEEVIKKKLAEQLQRAIAIAREHYSEKQTK
jgi:hypothetical protein